MTLDGKEGGRDEEGGRDGDGATDSSTSANETEVT